MKSWTQGCALEASTEVLLQSQAASKGHHPHAPAPEALQNAAPVSRISIMGAKRTFAKTSKGTKGAFVRISIKIAVETVVHDFNQGSTESVFKRLHKAKACLNTLNGYGEMEIILSASRPLFR